jgi:hypothetical protein
MRVELQSTMANPTGIFRQGDVIDLPKEEAERLIAEGQAKPTGSLLSRRSKKPIDTPPEKE